MYKRKGLGLFLIILGGLCLGYFFSALSDFAPERVINPRAYISVDAILSLIVGVILLPTGIISLKRTVIYNENVDIEIMMGRKKKIEEFIFDEKTYADDCIKTMLKRREQATVDK